MRAPRNIKFDFVSRDHAEVLSDQLLGAMQIIAALILTDEEASTFEGCDPEWVRGMREEILSPEWRPELLKALRHQGFLTNTHPGFCVSPLAQGPTNLWRAAEAYAKLEKILEAYSEGEGEKMEKGYVETLIGRLVSEGFDAELSSWVMGVGGGGTLACEAMMERLVREAFISAENKKLSKSPSSP